MCSPIGVIGFFGKYLNGYKGDYIPIGWKQWTGLVRNSRYYNYTLNVNGRRVRHGDDYKRDYFPDLIVNQSITFLRQREQQENKPFLLFMSFPSPHGPEDSAPQYQHLFLNVTTHRSVKHPYM